MMEVGAAGAGAKNAGTPSKRPPALKLRQTWGLLAHYLRPQAGRVALAAVLLLAAIALQLANPQIIRYFLDTAQTGGAGRGLLLAALAYIGFAVFQQIMNLGASYTSQQVSWSATNRLRTDLALHVLRLDMPFHKRHTPGELIERIDGDVTQLSNFFSQFSIRLLSNALLVLGILVLLARENPLVGLAMALYAAVTLVVIGLIQRLATVRWAAARQASAEQYGYIEERISGVEDIRATGVEAFVMRGLYQRMRVFLRTTRAAHVVGNLTYNLTNLVYVLGYAAGLALGVVLYSRGQATIGTAYLIVTYVGMLSEPLQAIRAQLQDLQQAGASILRIQVLFSLRPQVGGEEAGSAGLPARLPAGALSVSFSAVSFRYEGEPEDSLPAPLDDDLPAPESHDNVLEQVSFELAPGKVLGIVGRTGSGKSTLSRLLFRLYDPSQGAIRLGGAALHEIPLQELRKRVGMVAQDVQLFQATLRDNLALFNHQVTDARLEQVLKELRLWDWARSLPQGLDTTLAGGGGGLSAGEAQLLAFGRVFLKDPGLVILDEASSRLDPATETLMEQAIDRLFAGRSGVIIAHRLRTLDRADDILFLENGHVVEYGPRRRLAADPTSRFYGLLQTGLEEVLV